ncbi:aminotransferase class III-fold pyridoxal phosphate-dependent enzyme [Streptomyces sp. MST-110588]|uniref:aminotransferase family protein n=1 Tax=Streptomyces sp. MST-110588 TaxID=2833628 RepID=UPI001F5D8001|nr:aminotransferase class III-fold pyridoxal phosphate-dependent enzyme [Streptomyces sp. MST-110588]UNO43217.1 aspartate aminotransferase family protein [Streptomyces sp. MST-110588]
MSLTNGENSGVAAALDTDVDEGRARERDRRFVWHPWSPVEASGQDALVLVSGRGDRVRDAAGREYLDAMACALNSSCGYAHPALVAAAERQMSLLPHYDLSVGTHLPVGRVAERLGALLPEGLGRTLFLNSGSEATEAAVRIAHDYWTNKGEPRSRIVTFAAGYHGTTYIAQHLSGLPTNAVYGAEPFPVTRVRPSLPARELRTPEALPALVQEFEHAVLDGTPPAAVFVEPLLNVGGGVVLPAGFLRALRELCDRCGTLLIVDEVFCGFGRTGRMFGFEHDGVTPDLVTMSKGLSGGYVPFAALSTTEEVYASFAADPLLGGLRYGHTTGGHAVACAVALAVLDVIEERKLVQASATLGEQLLAGLRPLLDHREVLDVRGLGLVATVECAGPEVAAELVAGARARGVLLRRQGAAVMAIPPLVIGESGVAELVSVTGQALAAL